MATAKHFADYSETQGGRDASEADISHRKLRSWFLPPYQRVADEGVASFMLGYQTTDGVPITINDWLLTDVLRGKWDYCGILVTDWDNVGRMVWEQQIQPDYRYAAAAAVKAGNDMIMTTPQFYEGALVSQSQPSSTGFAARSRKTGKLPMRWAPKYVACSRIRMVRRILMGSLDGPSRSLKTRMRK